MKTRRLIKEHNYLIVNGVEVHPMPPAKLYTAVFECLCVADIEFRSSDALKNLYFGLLDVICDMCEEERIEKHGAEAARYSRYITRSQKQRLILISVVRKLQRNEGEEVARQYLLGVLYNEALRGFEDVCRIRGDFTGMGRKKPYSISNVPKLKGEM